MRGEQTQPVAALSKKTLVGIGAAIVITVALVAWLAIRMGSGDSDQTQTIAAAQEFVKVKFTAATHFAPLAETTVQDIEDDKVKVSGTLDVINSIGQGAGYSYTVIMHQNPDGEWVADDVSLVPMGG